jgi:hypothetical protein
MAYYERSMNVTYACKQCERVYRRELTAAENGYACECGYITPVETEAIADGEVSRCAVCPSSELFVRKDFSQRLGVTIVVVGLASSCIPWYFGNWFATFALLFATALADVLLYLFVGNVLQCYRCHAEYRGLPDLEGHAPFSLEVHERHRQQLARLAQAEAQLHGSGSRTHTS